MKDQSLMDAPNSQPREVRHSLRFLFADSTFFLIGFAFIDASTVLPAFLHTLTASSLVIGLIMAIKPTMLLIPQLWTAHYLRNHRFHKRYLMTIAMASRTAVLAFAVLLFFCGPNNRTIMLIGFLVMYAVMWLSEGGVGVSWFDLVAKTIPERLRGRLFGGTQVVGGIGAVFAGIVVGRILSHSGPKYPTNYAILFLLAAIFIWSSLISLSFVREPEGAIEEDHGSFTDYLKTIFGMLAKHRELKHYLAVQFLMAFFAMSFPFYILYAQKMAGISGATIGMLLAVQILGTIVWSTIVAFVNDHRSPKAAIVIACLAGLVAPTLAILVGKLPVWYYGIIFFAVGAMNATCTIGLTSFILEMAGPHERRTFVGLINTANAPTLIFPILGGLIIQTISYRAVFMITALALLAALILALTLKSPRRLRN